MVSSSTLVWPFSVTLLWAMATRFLSSGVHHQMREISQRDMLVTRQVHHGQQDLADADLVVSWDFGAHLANLGHEFGRQSWCRRGLQCG
jgi:hypothetical protein